MSFRAINQKYLEPGSQVLMVLGIIALCQPWNLFLHRYGVTIILIGLLTFMFTGWFGKPDGKKEENDGVFDVSDHHDGRQHGGSS